MERLQYVSLLNIGDFYFGSPKFTGSYFGLLKLKNYDFSPKH